MIRTCILILSLAVAAERLGGQPRLTIAPKAAELKATCLAMTKVSDWALANKRLDVALSVMSAAASIRRENTVDGNCYEQYFQSVAKANEVQFLALASQLSLGGGAVPGTFTNRGIRELLRESSLPAGPGLRSPDLLKSPGSRELQEALKMRQQIGRRGQQR